MHACIWSLAATDDAVCNMSSMYILYHAVLKLQAPSIQTTSSGTSIRLSWTHANSDVVDTYEIVYYYNGDCTGISRNEKTTSTTERFYNVTGLEENSFYTFTITAVNHVNSSPPAAVTNSTLPTGTYV